MFLITYAFFTVGCISYFVFLGRFLTTGAYIIGVILCLIQNLSYLYTAAANPGLANEYEFDDYYSNRKYCSKCKIHINFDTSYHCTYCDICIAEHDHHCPWTSKCIGKKTLYSFYIFVLFTFVLFFYLFFAILFSAQSTKPNKLL